MTVRWSVERQGTGGAVPLLLLNSLGFSGADWGPVATDLGARRRVIAPDRRGHGRTPYAAPESFDELVDDVVRVLDDESIQRADVLGLSMGGTEAMSLAIRHPDRVRGLVLVDTFAELPEQVRAQRLTATRRRLDEAGVEALTADLMDGVFGGRVHPDLVTEAARTMALLGGTALWELTRVLYDAELLDRLTGVTAPTLVIVGDRDERTPVSTATEIARRIPGAQLEVFPGVGHFPHLEDPTTLTETVEAFLDGLEHHPRRKDG